MQVGLSLIGATFAVAVICFAFVAWRKLFVLSICDKAVIALSRGEEMDGVTIDEGQEFGPRLMILIEVRWPPPYSEGEMNDIAKAMAQSLHRQFNMVGDFCGWWSEGQQSVILEFPVINRGAA